MRTKFSHLSAVVLAVLCFAVASAAQDDTLRAAAGDKYLISAKAGGVNFVEGSVGVVRKEGRGGLLIKGDKLEIGDRVSTDADGRAEILLNPGSYLRLGGNSAFEFKTTSLDDLQLMVGRGSAILEVFAADDFKVTVLTPAISYDIVESGVYRVNVPENGSPSLEVWKGKALAAGTAVKGGKVATGTESEVTVAKFDRDEKDALELWSKSRAKELAKVTASLQRKTLRPVLMQSFLGRRWNVFDSFGLWVYDISRGAYCFLPFGYGWASPYGYGFGQSLWWYNLPRVVYSYQGTVPTAGNDQQGTPIRSPHGRSPVPPFVRMQGTAGAAVNSDSPAAYEMPTRGPRSVPSAAPSTSSTPSEARPIALPQRPAKGDQR